MGIMTAETPQPSFEEHKEFMRQIPRLMEAELFRDQKIVKIDTIGPILITRTPDLKDFLRATFVFDG